MYARSPVDILYDFVVIDGAVPGAALPLPKLDPVEKQRWREIKVLRAFAHVHRYA